jgi:cytoskeleton protein RodZ
MIERANEFGAPEAVAAAGGDGADMTAGGILREAREAQKLHIEVIAATLKVSPQKLAALEADNMALLPDPVFTRALAASVCRALRIDPAPVLAKLPGAPSSGLVEVERTLGTTVRSTAMDSGPGIRFSRLSLIVILLLIGAAILFWLPRSLSDRIGDSISRMVQRDAPGEQTADAPKPESPSPATDTATVTEPAAPAAPPAPAEPPAPPVAPVAVSRNDLIVFVVREDTWISVTDADGGQLLQRTVKAGETVGLNGARPLSVVIGHAAGVEVRVRNKPFDLARLTGPGGVARFEVKA